MQYTNNSYQYVEELGFKDSGSYWQKRVAYGRYIRIFTDTHEIRFFEENSYNYDDKEITDYVPIWAFITITKMIMNNLIGEN